MLISHLAMLRALTVRYLMGDSKGRNRK